MADFKDSIEVYLKRSGFEYFSVEKFDCRFVQVHCGTEDPDPDIIIFTPYRHDDARHLSTISVYIGNCRLYNAGSFSLYTDIAHVLADEDAHVHLTRYLRIIHLRLKELGIHDSYDCADTIIKEAVDGIELLFEN